MLSQGSSLVTVIVTWLQVLQQMGPSNIIFQDRWSLMAVVSQQSFNFKVLQYTVAVGASHLLQISLTFLTAIVDIVAKPTYIVWRHCGSRESEYN